MKKLIKKTLNSTPQTVYDIEVANDHNYTLFNELLSHNSMYPEKEISGGTGLKYAASTILMLSKRKDKNKENEVIGNIIHCKLYKARGTREQKMVDVKLSFSTGLDKYYGLLPIAIKYGIFSQIGNKVEVAPDVKVFESKIFSDPEKFYTPEVLKRIDEACAKEFKYGQNDEVPVEETDELTSEGIDE